MRVPSTCSVLTLGCKVNQYDGQVIREYLANCGLTHTRPGAPPDVLVVNACTVTARADQKCRQLVRRMARSCPDARIVVTGCYARRDAEQAMRLPGVVAALAPSELDRLPQALGLQCQGAPDFNGRGICSFDSRSRAFIKVQDGCDAACSYCIVPHVRPGFRSRRPDCVAAETERLVKAGFREIVLVGIRLGSYGRDWGGTPDLADLMKTVDSVDGLSRFRLSSLEPIDVCERILSVASELPKLCRHLHLPLQSGSDRMLRLMNRPYDAAEYARIAELAREMLPGLTLTTDVIVGFPGETDADFAATVEFCRGLHFGRIHVFRFSPRDGTPAAAMKPKVDGRTVAARAAEMRSVADRLAEDVRASLLGRRLRVVVESSERCDKGFCLEGYADQYQRVRFSGPEALLGSLAWVRATAIEDGILRAEQITARSSDLATSSKEAQ